MTKGLHGLNSGPCSVRDAGRALQLTRGEPSMCAGEGHVQLNLLVQVSTHLVV